MQGILALEDGTVFTGKAFGAAGEKSGEVVFYTGMTGYQRLLGHANSQNKILVMTYPLMGNCGITEEGGYAPTCRLSGLVVREICHTPNHRQTVKTLPDYLAEHKVLGISEIDTRALTRHLRQSGVMGGVISTEKDVDAVARRAKKLRLPAAGDLVVEASVKKSVTLPGKLSRIIIVDLGGGLCFGHLLKARGYDVVVMPHNSTMEEILGLGPAGVVFSDGAGTPGELSYLVERVRGLLSNADRRMPIFGIGVGCQLLALAHGARVEKMKFGHRGDNYPVRDVMTNRVYITSQNHGYVVAGDSLAGTGLKISHVNVNDQTVEGFCHRELPLFGMQFEAGALATNVGADSLLESFLKTISEGDCRECL